MRFLLVTAALLLANNAWAAMSLPNDLNDCMVGDIDPEAKACRGYFEGTGGGSGNPDDDLVNTLKLFGFDTWQLAAADDGKIIDKFGINFDSDLNVVGGMVSMDAGLGGPNLPLMLTLKYANGFDAFLLNVPTPDTTDTGTTEFTFQLPQALSNAELYYVGDDCCLEPQSVVSTPGALALFVPGLIALGGLRLRG